MKKMYSIKQRFAITPEEMAAASVNLATSPIFETITGEYFDKHLKTVKMPRFAHNDEACSRLCDLSSKLVQLS